MSSDPIRDQLFLDAQALLEEFPGSSLRDRHRILRDRRFEREMCLRYGGGTAHEEMIKAEPPRGTSPLAVFFDEIEDDHRGMMQVNDRMGRGPLPEGTVVYPIEQATFSDEMFKMLQQKRFNLSGLLGDDDPPVREHHQGIIDATAEAIRIALEYKPTPPEAWGEPDTRTRAFPELAEDMRYLVNTNPRMNGKQTYANAVAKALDEGKVIWDIFAEGYRATGDSSTATHVGRGYGHTFDDAVRWFNEHVVKGNTNHYGTLTWDADGSPRMYTKLHSTMSAARQAYG